MNSNIPNESKSYWRESVELPNFSSYSTGDSLDVDVVVIGAGITGITAASELTKGGAKVALLEASRLINGTTGHTTAKVTAQHGLIYDELIHHFGIERAQGYYNANNEALQYIVKTNKELGAEAQITIDDAYVYTQADNQLSKLEKEATAYEKLGIKGGLLYKTPLPFEVKSAVVMNDQAQFHPLSYLTALLHGAMEAGLKVFEQSPAVDIEEENEKRIVVLRNGAKITSKKVIISSHYPFYDGGGLYFTKMYASRSYVLAAKTKNPYPGGMYISQEKPTRSLRSVLINGEQHVLFSGEDHKAGQGIPEDSHYEALYRFADNTFGVLDNPFKWSAQDLISVDKMPYIGPITKGKQHVYVATGYRKWGMTNGTAAALLLSNKILQGSSQYEDVFAPQRFAADPSIRHFIKENSNVAKELLKGKLEFSEKIPEDVAAGEGSIVHVDGNKAGAYREDNGTLHVVDTTCTHLGCEVKWNKGDCTWDCPCHGSRFTYTGDVLEGPAVKPLKKLR